MQRFCDDAEVELKSIVDDGIVMIFLHTPAGVTQPLEDHLTIATTPDEGTREGKRRTDMGDSTLEHDIMPKLRIAS